MTLPEVEACTILRAVVGSQAHGTNLEGTDDRDEMGICLEPLRSIAGFSQFDQFIFRSAAIRDGKPDAKSKPGDLDLVIYGLRKYLRLVLSGNPTVMMMQFVTLPALLTSSGVGAELQGLSPFIVARSSGRAFLGYMESQRQKILGERGQKKVNRPELEEKYGYDTKYAGHIIRLGFQGVELLSTGKITLPMPPTERALVLAIRKGEVPMQDMLQKAGELEREVKDLIDAGPLQEKPDVEAVEDWLVATYRKAWL